MERLLIERIIFSILCLRPDINREELEKNVKMLAKKTPASMLDWLEQCNSLAEKGKKMLWEK